MWFRNRLSNPVVRLLRRVMPVAQEYHGQRFFVRQALTPGGAARPRTAAAFT